MKSGKYLTSGFSSVCKEGGVNDREGDFEKARFPIC